MLKLPLAPSLLATLALPLLAALCVPLTVPAQAHAQQGAQAFLEHKHEEVNQLLRTAANNAAARQRRSRRLTGILSNLLDYEGLSQRALGEHWEGQTPEARTRFVNLLRQLVERNYESNLERILDFEISYEAEARRGEHTMVSTSARSRENRRQPAVEIEYLMRPEGREWRVIDVTTDGVSMVENYRRQFNRIISRDGWDELITRMEARLADG